MRKHRQWAGIGLAPAALLMEEMPAYAQLAADAGVKRDALHRFVDDNMLLAFGIVALLGFIAGAVLSHLRNK